MFILLPPEDRFYTLIEAAASNVSKGAEMLVAMLSERLDTHRRESEGNQKCRTCRR
jgi:hypothetical protein